MRLPTEEDYISEETAVPLPEGVNVQTADGLTRVRFERPPHIPPNPPMISPAYPASSIPPLPPGQCSLLYDFALLPDVQFHGELRGPATADHIEQLVEYLQVAARKMREQEARRVTKRKKHELRDSDESSA